MSNASSDQFDSQRFPVGIDLGTTYSALAYVDEAGRPVTVPNAEGELLTSSSLFVDEDAIIVDREAAKVAVMAPDAFAECFKRDIGRSTYRRYIGPATFGGPSVWVSHPTEVVPKVGGPLDRC